MARKKTLPEIVREAVDRGATSVEEVHKAIAHLPLDVLEKLDGLKEPAEKIKRIEDATIGAVYDTIRRANAEVTKLAAELLPAPPKRTRRPAKR
jgi:hypothetical protein